jgi:hypothetical protein
MRKFRVKGGLNQDESDVFTLSTVKGTITCVGLMFNGARSIGEVEVREDRETTMLVDLEVGAISIYAVRGEDVQLITQRSSRGLMQERLKEGTYQLRLIGKDATFRIVISRKKSSFKVIHATKHEEVTMLFPS